MLKAKVSTCGKGSISVNLCLYPNSLLYARHFITGSKNSSVYGPTPTERVLNAGRTTQAFKKASQSP